MSSTCNKNVPDGILKISDPNHKPILNDVKNRCLILSPTVNAGLEPEAKISDFEKEREIGKGGFGLVWKVIHKKTQKVYCIKVIEKKGIIEQKLVDQMNREIEIMYILNHPHCLRLKNHFEDDNNFYLVMPLAVKGQLYKVLRKFRKFDERTTAQILRETISALQYLHSFNPPIIHRDIKPENLLLNEGGRVLLADFGWSNFSDGDVRKTFCGTPEYIAPEMLLKKGHDTRVDIWSIGILMFELLSGYSPFVAKSNQELYSNIRKLKIHWPRDMPPLAKNLITKILKLDIKERPSLQEILDHQWFKQTKIIKPLLENNLNSQKDLLSYHLLSGANEEILNRINNLLNLSGKDADNTNAKNIMNSTPDSESLSNKKNIVKAIKEKNEQINNMNKKQVNNSNSTNNSELNTISSINVTKEESDLLSLENAKLKKDCDTLRAKNISIDNELKKLRNENQKLKEENTANLKEIIKKKDEEIEKLQCLDKDRIQNLAELEEKSKIILDLKSKIKILEGDIHLKENNIESQHNKINELQKQIEIKDLTINDLNKKNDLLTQEKEMAFIDYQKKLEEMQIKLLDGDNSGSENGLTKVIEILNGNVDEFKKIFKKKIENFSENFNRFKDEYQRRDETLTLLLNNKTQLINEQIKNFSENLLQSEKTTFENVNKSNSSVKDQKIEWLNKQVSELSSFKNKNIECNNKINELTKKLTDYESRLKLANENLNIVSKSESLKDEAYKKMKGDYGTLEQKISDMTAFVSKNLSAELYREFRNAFK